jgi:hypothetical protein
MEFKFTGQIALKNAHQLFKIVWGNSVDLLKFAISYISFVF